MCRSPLLHLRSAPYLSAFEVCHRCREVISLRESVHLLAPDSEDPSGFGHPDEVLRHAVHPTGAVAAESFRLQ